MKIKVVFVKDTQRGKRGEIKSVSVPMFNNILFPKKFAFKVDSSEGKDFLKKLKKNDLEQKKQIDLLKQIVNELSERPLVFKKKVTPKGYLYDKITPQEISKVILKRYGLKIPKEKIKLLHKIDMPGIYPVTINWHNVKGDIKIEIKAII